MFFLLIFVSLIIADLIVAGMYGWIASPKMFWLRGFRLKMFFEINFWLIVSLALYSWPFGPQYFRMENDTIVSIGTWNISKDWTSVGLVPTFTGWAFWRPVLIYIPKK